MFSFKFLSYHSQSRPDNRAHLFLKLKKLLFTVSKDLERDIVFFHRCKGTQRLYFEFRATGNPIRINNGNFMMFKVFFWNTEFGTCKKQAMQCTNVLRV